MFVTSSNGEIRVKKCVPGGPADVSQSIKQGDVLLRIDGFNCSGVSLKDIQPRVLLALICKALRRFHVAAVGLY